MRHPPSGDCSVPPGTSWEAEPEAEEGEAEDSPQAISGNLRGTSWAPRTLAVIRKG